MALSFIEKFKQRKAQKEEQSKQQAEKQARVEKMKEDCKENFEAFKIKTMANQAKVGKIEEVVDEVTKEKDNSTTKTTIVYTQFGPITKKDVHETYVKDGKHFVNDYINYEGYIAPKHSVDEISGIIINGPEKSGYFNITHKVYYLPNPVERETHVIHSYTGTNLDHKGNVEIINETEENEYVSGDFRYSTIISKFENEISEIQKKNNETELNK